MRDYYISRIRELLAECDADMLEAIYRAIYHLLQKNSKK